MSALSTIQNFEKTLLAYNQIDIEELRREVLTIVEDVQNLPQDPEQKTAALHQISAQIQTVKNQNAQLIAAFGSLNMNWHIIGPIGAKAEQIDDVLVRRTNTLRVLEAAVPARKESCGQKAIRIVGGALVSIGSNAFSLAARAFSAHPAQPHLHQA